MNYVDMNSVVKAAMNEEFNTAQQFKRELCNAISNDYNLNFTQAEKIYEYAWEEDHSYGCYSVANRAADIADLIEEVIKAA